jgi:large conductance mechanosensitive channel
MSLMQEFKEFALKGNVVDLAVGVVIGGAFGKIVSSVVSDIITPAIGLFMGGVDFKGLKYTIPAVIPGATPASITYGQFIQNVFDFTVVAFVLFMVIKAMNKMKRETPAVPDTPPELTADQKLLTDIRDLLQKQSVSHG